MTKANKRKKRQLNVNARITRLRSSICLKNNNFNAAMRQVLALGHDVKSKERPPKTLYWSGHKETIFTARDPVRPNCDCEVFHSSFAFSPPLPKSFSQSSWCVIGIDGELSGPFAKREEAFQAAEELYGVSVFRDLQGNTTDSQFDYSSLRSTDLVSLAEFNNFIINSINTFGYDFCLVAAFYELEIFYCEKSPVLSGFVEMLDDDDQRLGKVIQLFANAGLEHEAERLNLIYTYYQRTELVDLT